MGGLFLARGQWVPALVLFALAAALALPTIGDRIAAVAERIGRKVADVLALVLLAVVEVVVVTPAWLIRSAVARLRGRHGEWERRPSLIAGRDRPNRTFARERIASAPRRTPIQRLWNAVGIVLVVLLVNYGLGFAWDETFHHSTDKPVPSVVNDSIHFVPSPTSVPANGQVSTTLPPTTAPPPDPRATLPAMRGMPWAAEYFNELHEASVTTYPYLIFKPLAFKSQFINVTDDWERVSYEPAHPAGLPVVWFFGGSTMFGEGQRDDHTIPSEIARLAEQAGKPVVVRNFGQRGFVNWQEMLLFEQLLATQKVKPSLVVFYDGVNDVNTQSQHTFGQPSFYDYDGYIAHFNGQVTTPSSGAGPSASKSQQSPSSSASGKSVSSVGDAWSVLVREYAKHSLVNRLVGKVSDWLGGSASAAPLPAVDPVPSTPPPCGQFPQCLSTDNQRLIAKATLDVYRRGRTLISEIAEPAHVRVRFFWQAMPHWSSYVLTRQINDQMDSPTVNVINALDGHDDVLLDGAHTNEAGAAIIAKRLWSTLSGSL